MEEDNDSKKEKSTALTNSMAKDFVEVRIQDKENQGDSSVKTRGPADQDATVNSEYCRYVAILCSLLTIHSSFIILLGFSNSNYLKK